MVLTIFISLPLLSEVLRVLVRFYSVVGSCREMGAVSTATDRYRVRVHVHPLSASVTTTDYGVWLPEALVTHVVVSSRSRVTQFSYSKMRARVAAGSVPRQ